MTDAPRPWHPYVFDPEGRRFVGAFEDMYRADQEDNFDAWFQSDPRRIEGHLSDVLLDQVSWSSVLDLGCGKGTYTVRLKRRDNEVTGVDMSETAIATARSYFPDVNWVCAPIGEHLASAEPVDLVVFRGTIVYMEDWREALQRCAQVGRYLVLDAYIPDGTLGFVKSHAELEEAIESDFEILELIALPRREVRSYLCESKVRAG